MTDAMVLQAVSKLVQEAHGDGIEVRDLKISYTTVTVVEEHEQVTLGEEGTKPKKRGPKAGGKKKGRRGRKKGSKNKPKEVGEPLLQ